MKFRKQIVFVCMLLCMVCSVVCVCVCACLEEKKKPRECFSLKNIALIITFLVCTSMGKRKLEG